MRRPLPHLPRRAAALLTAALASLALAAGTATADTPVPTEFGTDYHDPVTAAPPISTPHTTSCHVTVAEAKFKDFTPYTGTYTPPTGCGTPGRWSKVVLRMDGNVKGRQFDRLGYLDIGGVQVFRTSTPEPSQDGIDWSVQKDVTEYEKTLSSAQPVDMLIGNVVDGTYTGVLDVKVTLTFYAPERHRPAPDAPDQVIPLSAGDSVTTGASLTTPRNSERILAEVYATGSGGGCEEFWYTATTPSASYSCQGGDDGPYREVQVSVDGKVAGIASPYPNVWTGGWSPYLWSVIPSPTAFDVRPLTFDLTPFAGLLDDGRAHTVDVSVVGVPAGQTGWSAPTNVLVWQDAHRSVLTGGVTSYRKTAPALSNDFTDGSLRHLATSGGDHLKVSGYLNTSHGRVTTTVDRTLSTAVDHRWTPDENTDDVTGTWTDRQVVATNGRTARTDREYTLDGQSTIDSANRLRVVMSVGDHARSGATRTDDTYRGDATFTLGVAREDRHAVATTSERYRLRAPGTCYDHTLATEQGVLTKDVHGCRVAEQQ
ncbi:peptide-N4-asparagine amidase [Streptomyces griseorubiginosus]|uniref:peptide-N4-asparagine amidase n=1 Tax=Streptomyces griseorubiginosus TaxID=67304 RepID=UPI00076DA450|nr:peptide-N4-asparagine amidase [Streptomyces griseorubiginosus]KUM77258.1 peptide-N4-asparagine amidase A [Streptomyces griseorubiginosus]